MNSDVLDRLIKQSLVDGTWMIRRSHNGKSYGGFQWNPVGQWTEAPDWKPTYYCGNGLHGNDQYSMGFWSDAPDVDFCVYDPSDMIRIDNDKIKVKRAMVLLRNQLPDGLTIGGNLELGNTKITELPSNLTVHGDLNISYFSPNALSSPSWRSYITKLPPGLRVYGNLDLRYTYIKELPSDIKVEGDLDLRYSLIKSLPANLKIGGTLDLRYTNITELPPGLTVGGDLDISSTNIKWRPLGLTVAGDLYKPNGFSMFENL